MRSVAPEREPPEALQMLAPFARALRRESHVLGRRPDLLWQQLFNRLQWGGEAVTARLTPELARRVAPGAALWLRTRTPFRESESLVRSLTGEVSPVLACAISADASFIVSAGQDNDLTVWDTATWQERSRLRGHSGWVEGCAISDDGSFVVSASNDGTLKIWVAKTGRVLRTLEERAGAVTGCAISPDGSFIVSTSVGGVLTVWDTETGRARATLRGHASEVRGCAVSPDASFVVSASQDATLKVWDTQTWRERTTLRGHQQTVHGCAVSPDGASIASASWDGTLKIWDGVLGRERATLRGHGRPVLGCAFSPDGTFIVSAGQDTSVRLWDTESAQQRATLWGHGNAVRGCAVSPDGSFIVSASQDNTLKIWEVPSRRESVNIQGHKQAVTGCAFSPDGSLLVSASREGTLKTWDTETGQELVTFRGHTSTALGCAFGPDGTYVVSVGGDQTVRIWEAGSGVEIARLRGHTSPVGCCAVSPDGSFIVSGDSAGLRIWDTETGRERATLQGHTGSVQGCAVSPDGSFIVSASWDETLKTWEAQTGRELATLRGHEHPVVYGCAVSPDGAWIVSASSDKTLKVWDTEGGKERLSLRGHADAVWDCAVSPDGALVVSASSDGSLKVWDVESGQARATLALPGSILCVALHPSRPLAVCGESGGSVHLVEFIGVEYGRIVVTATDSGEGPVVRCPSCQQRQALEDDSLGRDIECTDPDCRARMRVNPFILKGPRTLGLGLRLGSAASSPTGAAQPRAVPRAVSGLAPPPSLPQLLAAAGLNCAEAAGGTLIVPFRGLQRVDQLVLQVGEVLPGLAGFAVGLPQPPVGNEATAFTCLLCTAFEADYVKVLALESGPLLLAVELPTAVLTPPLVDGLVRGLAHLADLRSEDLCDVEGWTERIRACASVQAARFRLDVDQIERSLIAMVEAAGLRPVRSGEGIYVAVDLGGVSTNVVVHPSQQVVSFIVYLSDLEPEGDRKAYLRYLIELNRAAKVAKVGIDSDGDAVLLYQVPGVFAGLLQHMRVQLGGLLHSLGFTPR